MGLSYAKLEEPKSRASDLKGETVDDGERFFDTTGEIVVENVHIDGVVNTEAKLITKQLEDVFKAKTFDDTVSRTHDAKLRLQRLGIFKGVDVFIDVSRTENPDPRGIDVHFIVEEAGRLTANAGTNVGNNEGSMVLGARLNNIRGRGTAVRADASVGSRASSSYEVGVTKPLLYNVDTKLGIRAYRATTDYAQSAFKEQCHGAGAEVSVPSPLGMHTFALDGVWRENTGMTQTTPFTIRETAGHHLKTSFKYTFVSDGRDDWIFPSAGSLLKHTVELASPALLGNCHFLKAENEFQMNRCIFGDIVLGMSGQCGAVASLSGKDTPINDKYFLGGPLSLRGFQMKSIGPRDDQAALGGNAYVAGGLHLYTPLPFRPGRGGFGDMFRLHFFTNAGNLINANPSLAVAENAKQLFQDFRWSYGAGIMFMLGGIARLELNYCFPMNAQPGDAISPGFQAGVGLSFL